jgi:hypothetical protein
MAGGILGNPLDTEEELSGILGNLGKPSWSQMAIQMGAQLASNAHRGWGAGIGGGFNAIADMQRDNDQARIKLLGGIADIQSRRAQTAAEAPYRQAQVDNWRSLIQARDADANLIQSLMDGGGSTGEPNGSVHAPSTSSIYPLQPQSFTPGPQGMVGQDPNLRMVADQGAPMPSALTPKTMQQQLDVIDTPYGRLPRERAMQLGGQLMLSPKYATAGKALVEQAQGGKNPGVGVAANNQLEERTLNSATHLARLTDIEKQFDPKYLEIPNRLKMMGASWSAKLGPQLGGKLAPDQQAELSRYASFRSGSVNNLNTILKELSGAAVTPQEYERIQNDQPVAGTGIFDGDDPVSFQAKMKRATQTLRSAIARFNFMRSKGLNFDKDRLDQFLALDDVPRIYEQRGAEIEQQLRQQNPNANPMQLQQGVQQKLKQEFGI